MSLLKTSVWSALIVIVGSAVGFISQKLYAIHTGASGLLAIGNFNNFAAIVYIAGSGGIYAGIVKTIASVNERDEQQRMLKSIFGLLACFSLVSAAILLLTDRFIYPFLYNDLPVSRMVNMVFYLTLPFIIFSNGILYVMNGRNLIRKYAVISIAIHIINLVLTWFFVKHFQINGALFSLFLPSVAGFLLMLIIARENFAMPSFSLNDILNKGLFRTLLGFSAVAILSILLLSASQLIVRDFILSEYSIPEAGNWQALSNISKIWMAVITGILSIYFFPKVVSLQLRHELSTEIRKLLTSGIPILILLFLVIFIFSGDLLQLVYSAAFEGGAAYMAYQLVGDLLKSIGMVFGYVFLAKGQLRPYAFTEIAFTAIYIALSFGFGKLYGMQGVFMAYAVSYLLYTIMQIWIYNIIKTN
ncbi:MAG: hypothetical protein ACKOYC_09130 [Bacteroidota bacterium]